MLGPNPNVSLDFIHILCTYVIIYHLLYTVKNVRQSLPYLLGNIESSGVKSLMRKEFTLLEEIGSHIVAKRKSFFKDLF